MNLHPCGGNRLQAVVDGRYFCHQCRQRWQKGMIEMASLSVRNLDDELFARLRRRAARHGRSTESEVRDILRRTLEAETEIDFLTLAAEMRALTAGRNHTPAEDLVREGRDER